MKTRILFVLGIIIGLFGTIIAILEFNDLFLRMLGIVMCLISAYIFKVSRRDANAMMTNGIANNNINDHAKPGVTTWSICCISALSSILFFLIFIGSVNEIHPSTWVIYAFIASITIFTFALAYILGVFVSNLFRQ